MNWPDLSTVLAIARTGSLTQAAAMLQVDQTTVGRKLSAIEQGLDAKLFLRSKAGFILTESGKIVVEHAQRIEADLDDMNDDLQAGKEEVTGVVRFLANPWMLERLAATALPTLVEKHPRLELRMSTRLPPLPLFSEATVSMWFDAPPLPNEEAIPFCKVPFATYRSIDAPDDQTTWVQFRDDNALGPSFTRQIRKRLGEDIQVVLTATDASILKSAIAAGVGKGILPVHLAKDDPKLVQTESEQIRLERVLNFHVNPDNAKSRRVSTVLDWVRGAASDAFGGVPIS